MMWHIGGARSPCSTYGRRGSSRLGSGAPARSRPSRRPTPTGLRGSSGPPDAREYTSGIVVNGSAADACGAPRCHRRSPCTRTVFRTSASSSATSRVGTARSFGAWALHATIAGADHPLAPRLETVLLEPDAQRMTMLWRATLAVDRRELEIDAVTVDLREHRT